MNYRLTHNGYKISWHEDMEEILVEIEKKLEDYKHLNPKKIVDDFETILPDGKPEIRFIVYRYSTLYDECFMVEKV